MVAALAAEKAEWAAEDAEWAAEDKAIGKLVAGGLTRQRRGRRGVGGGRRSRKRRQQQRQCSKQQVQQQVQQEVRERLDQVQWEERRMQQWAQEEVRDWWLEQRRAVWVGGSRRSEVRRRAAARAGVWQRQQRARMSGFEGSAPASLRRWQVRAAGVGGGCGWGHSPRYRRRLGGGGKRGWVT